MKNQFRIKGSYTLTHNFNDPDKVLTPAYFVETPTGESRAFLFKNPYDCNGQSEYRAGKKAAENDARLYLQSRMIYDHENIMPLQLQQRARDLQLKVKILEEKLKTKNI